MAQSDYSKMDKEELIALLEAKGTPFKRKINTEVFNDPSQMEYEGRLAGGRRIRMRRLSVPQQDAIQVSVAEAYKDKPHMIGVEAAREQYLASLLAVGDLERGGSTTSEELWATLGRARGQYTQLWHVAHDTTEEEDFDFFDTVRPVTSGTR